MRKKLPIPFTVIIVVTICTFVTICWAAQAAAKYVIGQEKKNALIESSEENIDVLRSCLSPRSRMPTSCDSLSGVQKESKGLVTNGQKR
jgi:hypothetical protein